MAIETRLTETDRAAYDRGLSMSERDEARRQAAEAFARDEGGASTRVTVDPASDRDASSPRIVVRPAPAVGDTHAQSVADTALSELDQTSLGGAPTVAVSTPHSTPGLTTDLGGRRREEYSAGSGMDSLVGQTLLDRYRITAQIGKGGMGAVYEAQHTLIGKRVAVKVLLDHYARRGPVMARLEQEAKLASSIGHEHIVDITDFGETPDGRTFVVMEYLEGESLGACLRREGQLDEERAVRIAHQVASALSAAHAKGILHRDIKPENVFLLRRKDTDFAKVVDFGISKSLHTGEGEGSTPRLTQTGMVLGTPLYMSPEQARGEEDLDQRIDVYALGVILYELVTGVVPFQGTNSLSIIARVINEEPQPPRTLRKGLSPELEAVILHAMAKDREQRYASCDAMAADLAALLAEVPVTGRLRLNAPLPRRRGKHNPSLPIKLMGLLVTVSTVLMACWVIWGGHEADPTPALPAVAAGSAIPAPVAPPEPPEPAPAEPETATISIVSEPPGAAIHEGGRVLGTTPFDFKPVKEDEDKDLVAKLDGYEDTPFRINVRNDDQREVLVALEKLPGTQRPSGRRPGAATQKPAPSVEQRPGGTSPSGTAGGELSGNPYRRKKD
jgi:serine/threonine-protein kinase